jgi:hypothetical protein
MRERRANARHGGQPHTVHIGARHRPQVRRTLLQHRHMVRLAPWKVVLL